MIRIRRQAAGVAGLGEGEGRMQDLGAPLPVVGVEVARALRGDSAAVTAVQFLLQEEERAEALAWAALTAAEEAKEPREALLRGSDNKTLIGKGTASLAHKSFEGLSASGGLLVHTVIMPSTIRCFTDLKRQALLLSFAAFAKVEGNKAEAGEQEQEASQQQKDGEHAADTVSFSVTDSAAASKQEASQQQQQEGTPEAETEDSAEPTTLQQQVQRQHRAGTCLPCADHLSGSCNKGLRCSFCHHPDHSAEATASQKQAQIARKERKGRQEAREQQLQYALERHRKGWCQPCKAFFAADAVCKAEAKGQICLQCHHEDHRSQMPKTMKTPLAIDLLQPEAEPEEAEGGESAKLSAVAPLIAEKPKLGLVGEEGVGASRQQKQRCFFIPREKGERKEGAREGMTAAAREKYFSRAAAVVQGNEH
ncbi:hypothetical protein cyc_08207 [Cyclospora cayetanensis]|uniref:C3H1-type domain-containing protein n=1 Tax=Cyclospora cayetanensis TaxID=88456 RepID=A0A1D3D626_9EIME|nr:hypothetical protein cyc_08207 [Cyclospora cayetanensis]